MGGSLFLARKAFQLPLSSFPPDAIDDAREWGAFPVVAYPDDPRYQWRYWNKDFRPSGIEVLNLFTSLAAGPGPTGFCWPCLSLLPLLFSKKNCGSRESIAHWDGLLQRDKAWAFVASDAHGGFHITSWLAIKVPSYADTFSFAGLGIDRRYESDPEAAIRSGDFFNCIRGAGEPERFEFSAQHGFQKFPSGSDAPAHSNLHVEVQIGVQIAVQAGKQATRLVLKKDGAALREIVGGHLDLENAAAGVYRVEVFLVGHPLLHENVPWILSNPIFVGLAHEPRPLHSAAAIRAQLAKSGDAFKR